MSIGSQVPAQNVVEPKTWVGVLTDCTLEAENSAEGASGLPKKAVLNGD